MRGTFFARLKSDVVKVCVSRTVPRAKWPKLLFVKSLSIRLSMIQTMAVLPVMSMTGDPKN